MITILAVLVGLVIAIAVVVALVRGGGAGTAAHDTDLPPDLATLDDVAFHHRLQQELAAGHKIVAIKWMRARTGLGLKEAKDAVEHLAAQAPGATFAPHADDIRALDEADFQARLLVELAAGRKIEAIKLYRERTGLGLKEAKDAVDALERGG